MYSNINFLHFPFDNKFIRLFLQINLILEVQSSTAQHKDLSVFKCITIFRIWISNQCIIKW